MDEKFLSQKTKEAMRIIRQIIELKGKLKYIENEVVSEKVIEEWMEKNKEYKLFKVKVQRNLADTWRDKDEIEITSEIYFDKAEKAIEWARNWQKERFYNPSAWGKDENGLLGVWDLCSYGECMYIERVEIKK